MALPTNILTLIEKRLQGLSLEAEERAELQQWISADPSEARIFADADWEKQLYQYLQLRTDQTQQEEALQRFLAAASFTDAPSSPPVLHRVHFLKKWGWAAAVILCLLGTVLYFLTTERTQEKPLAQVTPTVPTDILPGSNKAVLTLSNGQKITLDSAANGAIAQQGNTAVLKRANGEIVYDLKGAPQREIMLNTMSTPNGGQYQIRLPDGTKVWLNAASSITYPAAFVGKDRKVTISGEAYLEVAPNKAKPFLVNVAGQPTVEVLGTSFNINAYADERSIKSTLVEGRIKVVNGQRSRILTPKQQAVMLPGDLRVQPANVDQVLAWKNGYFNFDHLGLREMSRQIERWYDIDIQFPMNFQDLILQGEMDRHAHLSSVIRFFHDLGFATRLEGRTLSLDKK